MKVIILYMLELTLSQDLIELKYTNLIGRNFDIKIEYQYFGRYINVNETG